MVDGSIEHNCMSILHTHAFVHTALQVIPFTPSPHTPHTHTPHSHFTHHTHTRTHFTHHTFTLHHHTHAHTSHTTHSHFTTTHTCAGHIPGRYSNLHIGVLKWVLRATAFHLNTRIACSSHIHLNFRRKERQGCRQEVGIAHRASFGQESFSPIG